MTTHNLSLLDKYPGIVYRCADHRLEEVTQHYRDYLADENPER